MKTPSKAPEGAASAAEKPRRSYLPAAERRQLIIQAAQEVFARSNLKGARTREIAKAARVNQATLFEHFESKEALFHAAVVEPMLETMRGMQDRIPLYQAADTLETMRGLGQKTTSRHIETMFDLFPLLAAAIFSDAELGRKLYVEQLLPLLRARAEAIGDLTRPSLDPLVVEIATFGITFALAMHRSFTDDDTSAADLAEQITTLLVLGFTEEQRKG